MLFGGFVPAVTDRVARWGDGFLGAGLPPEHMAGLFARVQDAWALAGRSGAPRLVAQVDVAVGPDAVADEARAALRHYYGPDHPYLTHFLDRLLTTPEQLRWAAAAYAGIGADELVFYCRAADPDQPSRIADALG